MSLVLVVRMKVAEGNEERLAQVLDELARASREEPGCELYIPSRSTEDPRSYQIYEQYRDRAALEAHGASEHFQRLAAGVMFGLLEGERERTFYETIVD
jgi:quinol monooxygenase YgiN